MEEMERKSKEIERNGKKNKNTAESKILVLIFFQSRRKIIAIFEN